MFVPKTLSSAASQRNPRRRQRTNSDESPKPPSAKRQRSNLRQKGLELTSQNPNDNHTKLDFQERQPSTLSNEGVANSETAHFHRNIPIRAVKRPGKRVDEGEGTVVLSKTEFYTVTQLPTLPDQVLGLQTGPFRGSFGTSHGYALALTKSHAIVWAYSTTTPSPSPADVFTLAIPESCKEPGNTAPLGLLLSTVAGGVPGLMVVMPYTGKIIYWETISSAATLAFSRQKHSGIQGCIPGLLSGEHATDVINSEPSGVVVILSTGRVAHITIRDCQGKPAVTVSFLRSPAGGGRPGLLGSLRNALGGGFYRKDIATVRAGESHQRGQRDVVIATSQGLFEIWDTHWNNGSMLKHQHDVYGLLSEALGPLIVGEADDYRLKVLDFVLADCKSTNARDGPNSSLITAVVASVSHSAPGIVRDMFVVQMRFSDDVQVLSTNTIDFHGLRTHLDFPRVRLFVPSPGHTAFIVVGQSIVLLSLTISEHPTITQDAVSVTQQGRAFKDIIPLRSGESYEILGSGCENQSGEGSLAACLLMVRDFGIIRIAALPSERTKSNVDVGRITAKHKIEQAIFYGTMTKNPLNLTGDDGIGFPISETENAALEICQELMRSASEFIPSSGISVDQNLKLRAKALDDLALLLTQQNETIRREIWWQLLWSAEKLAAQRAMWKLEDEARKCTSKNSTLLAHIIGLMSEKFKTKIEEQTGDCDPVRHWFLYDTFQMEHIVPWIFKAIKPQKGSSAKQGRRMSEQLLEASDLSLAVLETAFRYRDENSSRYGIGDGYLEDGILTGDYTGLSEFWTSQRYCYIEFGHLLDLELDSCRAWIQKTTIGVELPETQTVRRIAKNSSRQLQILGLMHCERVRWLSSQESQKLIDESIATEQAHIKQRKWQLFKLAGIGHLDDAIMLAEQFRDMGALVELIIELQDQTKSLVTHQDSPNKNAGADENASERLSQKISFYFEKFGESWADSFFSRQISMGQSGILFAMKKFQPFVTQFLRKHPAYLRLGWINDVIGENDYEGAARSLEKLATKHESDIWSHRVELSLAKLANLAVWEESRMPDSLVVRKNVRRLEDFAEVDAVQEVIFAYVAPALHNAIDQKAEIDIAIEQFRNPTAADRPSLHEIFSEALAKIVTRQVLSSDELVDLLTRIYLSQVSDQGQDEIVGKQFYLALRIIRLSYDQRDPQYHAALQKLVWRRCMIDNNWEKLEEAAEGLGMDTESFLYATTLSRTLCWCLRDGLDEDSNYPSIYVPNGPHDVLLSDFDADLITTRFPPERRARISRDLARENEILLQQIEKGKLDFWFKNLFDSAKTTRQEPSGVSTEDDKNGNAHNETQYDSSTEKAQLSWL
ncbi:hypothetical protein BO85DRAFT_455907 [Aspergillus piperis CBS 112811]|uniref:Nuclear pore complex subunit Nup133 n=1 Tax=Aspergillus piperis CBS 112811 TaxID=1448313 RepID=A0A8G1RAW2_9EURO|nr:hypothetical protein BO85DRAFT_455907 [Aspergillus piperis CBS 112811]RAH61786.1 hypothetical protein BO85DRAFT_455907 [Aspergillus piperis CBS 112811]